MAAYNQQYEKQRAAHSFQNVNFDSPAVTIR